MVEGQWGGNKNKDMVKSFVNIGPYSHQKPGEADLEGLRDN